MIHIECLTTQIKFIDGEIPFGIMCFSRPGTFTAPYTGDYKVALIGPCTAGADGGDMGQGTMIYCDRLSQSASRYVFDSSIDAVGVICYAGSGGGGGASGSTAHGSVRVHLEKGQQVTISINNSYVSFGDYVSAVAGTKGTDGTNGGNTTIEFPISSLYPPYGISFTPGTAGQGGAAGTVGMFQVKQGTEVIAAILDDTTPNSGEDGQAGSIVETDAWPATFNPLLGGNGGAGRRAGWNDRFDTNNILPISNKGANGGFIYGTQNLQPQQGGQYFTSQFNSNPNMPDYRSYPQIIIEWGDQAWENPATLHDDTTVAGLLIKQEIEVWEDETQSFAKYFLVHNNYWGSAIYMRVDAVASKYDSAIPLTGSYITSAAYTQLNNWANANLTSIRNAGYTKALGWPYYSDSTMPNQNATSMTEISSDVALPSMRELGVVAFGDAYHILEYFASTDLSGDDYMIALRDGSACHYWTRSPSGQGNAYITAEMGTSVETTGTTALPIRPLLALDENLQISALDSNLIKVVTE